MPKLRPRMTYANVMATVAVFIALGGSSYAAITLSKNSVESKHIAKGAVKRSDIGRGAVNSAKVADDSLLREDFKAGELPTGPQGPKGDTGPQGPPNPNAVSAQNADMLDGVDSSQFQRVGLVQAGAANETEDQGFADVIRWDELATIQTDGDADSDGTVRVINTGSQTFTVRAPFVTSTQSPGGFPTAISVSGGPTSILIWSADGARSWLVVCAQNTNANPDEIRCHGVANRLG